MIVGIGCDITKIKRVERLLHLKNELFLNKILTKKEISLLTPTKTANYIAKRFAAKEAFSKALGTGIGKYVAFHDLEILSNTKGKPYFMLSKKLENYLIQEYGSFNTHVSMTDEREYAQAFVIIEKL